MNHEPLIVLSILRLRKKLKVEPTFIDLTDYLNTVLYINLEENYLKDVLQMLEYNGHLKIVNDNYNVSLSLLFYYTEILEPGDDSLESIEYIERRMKQLEMKTLKEKDLLT
ncbi:hypothetical protein [Paenibacillus sp. N3.4]|uniref:hypothetical protein n=1 Tax=Paenibacillus sp. N3.4 TaxID=2603222 RepID=UPI0011C85320|nr:hypothetical protein [Paenibacillus sp. N3.4]TXK80678.1 hypothetical protein FU659_17820 [Paenibacillus sp. N3.4]